MKFLLNCLQCMLVTQGMAVVFFFGWFCGIQYAYTFSAPENEKYTNWPILDNKSIVSTQESIRDESSSVVVSLDVYLNETTRVYGT